MFQGELATRFLGHRFGGRSHVKRRACMSVTIVTPTTRIMNPSKFKHYLKAKRCSLSLRIQKVGRANPNHTDMG